MDRSLDNWLTALAGVGCGSRRTGARDWNGPCPLCGGDDRFHLREREDRVLAGCRQCLDGAADARPRFGQLLRTLWPPPGGEPARPPRAPIKAPEPPKSGSPRGTDRDSKAVDRARRLWAAAKPLVPGIGPAWTYLIVRRRVWPPAVVAGDLGAAGAMPKNAVRELTPAAAVEAGQKLPPGAAGAVAYAYTDVAGDIGGVQVEAVSAGAESLTAWPGRDTPIKRLLWGRMPGRFIRLPARKPRADRPVVVTEGPVDALAAAWMWRGADVLGGFSTSALRQLTPADVAGYGRVILAGDRDPPGLAATVAGADRLAGVAVEVWTGDDGQDLADYLATGLAQAAPDESPSEQWTRFLED